MLFWATIESPDKHKKIELANSGKISPTPAKLHTMITLVGSSMLFICQCPMTLLRPSPHAGRSSRIQQYMFRNTLVSLVRAHTKSAATFILSELFFCFKAWSYVSGSVE
ncbi:hypothetical protein PoB_007641100 [Plakobranchus ocellatus]|uniref:Uncharacterized protein n=1 Tax=Plakobranchus ocellatus TaxID=259542 RepID=A0AAV4E1C7_9GAST|nr:hypothetical protein PoB_007641100 [Plakobranchus ocellatus]